MLAAVKMADAGTSVADVCRELGISHQTYYGWKKRFAGTTLTESLKLKELEKEHAKLNKLVAELTLDRYALREIVQKSFKTSGQKAAGRFSGQVFSILCQARLQTCKTGSRDVLVAVDAQAA